MASEEPRVELLQGSLDLIVLRTLATMGSLHAYAIASRLEQISDYPLDLNQGTLYPALVRLEQKGWIKGSWGKTENNREANSKKALSFSDLLIKVRSSVASSVGYWY